MKTKEAILQEIKCSERMIDIACKVFETTINRFNGKVLNKRLITALNEANNTNGLRFYLEGNKVELFNNIDRSFNNGPFCGYVDYDRITINIITIDDRINSEKTIDLFRALILKEKGSNLKRIVSISQIDDSINEHSHICELIREYNSKYSSDIRKSFDRIY